MATIRSFLYTDFDITEEIWKEPWDMPYTHYHIDYEIYVLTEGIRTVTIGDNKYTVGPLEATLFPSNIMHKSKGTTPFAGWCTHFSPQYLSSYFTPQAIAQLLECFHSPVIPLQQEEFDMLKILQERFIPNGPDNFTLLGDILTIFNKASKRALRSSEPDGTKNATSETAAHPFGNSHSITTVQLADAGISPRKKRSAILAYVDENFIDIQNISELAEYFQVSERYIFKIFKETHQMTPKDYINTKRLKAVCHLLLQTGAPIKTIAARCGYNSYEYFYRLFVNRIGCTPTEYRTHSQHPKA